MVALLIWDEAGAPPSNDTCSTILWQGFVAGKSSSNISILDLVEKNADALKSTAADTPAIEPFFLDVIGEPITAGVDADGKLVEALFSSNENTAATTGNVPSTLGSGSFG